MRVDVPAPDEIVDRLVAGLDRPRPPVAVLDPDWPAHLVADAHSALERAARAGVVADGDLVLFTSGSSGRPKGIVRTLESWRASLGPLSEVTGTGPDDVVWLPLPLTSGLSLYGAFHARCTGAGLTAGSAVPPAATVVHAVPTVLQRICADLESGIPSRLRTAVVAGAPLGLALRRRAESLGLAVCEYYGAAELSFVGWRRTSGAMTAFPGVEVRVSDDVLWARSPYLCRGYLRAEPRAALRRHSTWGEGWATVGDRVRAEGSGWHVVGRGDAAVTTGANTVVVEEVEAALSGLPGVSEIGVLGMPHPALGQVVAAVVVLAPSAEPTCRRSLEAAARRLPAPARPRRWYVAPALPRTSTGKLARGALADLVADLAPLP